MTAGPLIGPASAYPTFNSPASICFKELNDVSEPGLIVAILPGFVLADCALAETVAPSPAARVPAATPKKWNRAPGEAAKCALRERSPGRKIPGRKPRRLRVCRLQIYLLPRQPTPRSNYVVGATSASAGRGAGCGLRRRLRMNSRRRRLDARRSIFDQNAAK